MDESYLSPIALKAFDDLQHSMKKMNLNTQFLIFRQLQSVNPEDWVQEIKVPLCASENSEFWTNLFKNLRKKK